MHEQADILVVEDDANDLELTLNALGREDWARNTAVARDGEEALDFLFARGAFSGRSLDAPRLVILDLKLPRLDGIAVLKQIKVDPRTRSIPVVIFTSSKEECDMSNSYHYGANSYIQKPVDFREFRKTIAALGSYWMDTNQAPAGATTLQPPDTTI
jgi:two-component system, response regulator